MTKTIFERYGGFATFSKVVSAFYDRMLESEVVAPYFAGVDMRQLVDHQTKFVASVAGGPASYTDDALRHVHRQLAITGPAFAETARLLRETLEEFGLGEQDVEVVCQEFLRRRASVVSAGE